MRTNKYRAWDPELKQWEYFLLPQHAGHIAMRLGQGRLQHFTQYTGLNDKNEVEIYDGDVIRADKNGWDYSVEWSDQHSRWLFNDHGRTPEDYIGPGILVTECEVIGDIFPETIAS
jgi:hypothetical protein